MHRTAFLRIKRRIIYTIVCFFLFCLVHTERLYPDHPQKESVEHIINTCTFTRVQKPLLIHTDKKTLEYFIEHVEELTKHGKDFRRKELLLEVRGNNRYGIQMLKKRITGEFELAERKENKAIYLGYGTASVFFHFSGSIVLEVEYVTKKEGDEQQEEVSSVVHIKFNNPFFAFLAKAATPLLTPQLDKLIAQFSTKTKKVVEETYESGIKEK